jgi:hypothetical protein
MQLTAELRNARSASAISRPGCGSWPRSRPRHPSGWIRALVGARGNARRQSQVPAQVLWRRAGRRVAVPPTRYPPLSDSSATSVEVAADRDANGWRSRGGAVGGRDSRVRPAGPRGARWRKRCSEPAASRPRLTVPGLDPLISTHPNWLPVRRPVPIWISTAGGAVADAVAGRDGEKRPAGTPHGLAWTTGDRWEGRNERPWRRAPVPAPLGAPKAEMADGAATTSAPPARTLTHLRLGIDGVATST